MPFCTQEGCERNTNHLSARCSVHRQPGQVRVRMTKRDFQHFSDCEDVVFDLINQCTGDVELTFSGDQLATIRHALTNKQMRLGPDVRTKEISDGNALVFTYEHE